MSLTLIGLGVSADITMDGFQCLLLSEEVYVEYYTNPMDKEKISNLERLSNKTFIKLERDKLEGPYLVNKAKDSIVSLLVSGDPLTATTHITLFMEAKQKGVEVEVIHNSSIYSVAPARSGLQVYKFGKTASLVNPRPNYKPTSPLDIIKENLSRNLHTLVLLDTEPEPMEASVALDMLSLFENAIVLSRVGYDDEKINYGKIRELKDKNLGSPPYSIIVPAKLHEMEEEALKLI